MALVLVTYATVLQGNKYGIEDPFTKYLKRKFTDVLKLVGNTKTLDIKFTW